METYGENHGDNVVLKKLISLDIGPETPSEKSCPCIFLLRHDRSVGLHQLRTKAGGKRLGHG